MNADLVEDRAAVAEPLDAAIARAISRYADGGRIHVSRAVACRRVGERPRRGRVRGEQECRCSECITVRIIKRAHAVQRSALGKTIFESRLFADWEAASVRAMTQSDGTRFLMKTTTRKGLPTGAGRLHIRLELTLTNPRAWALAIAFAAAIAAHWSPAWRVASVVA